MKSAYIHIPFCKDICSYCDFCKMYYKSDWVDNYLEELEKEIKLNYKGEILNTIYIGGGTPTSLSESQLERLFIILSNLNKDNFEYTIEANVESLNIEKIKLFKKYGINRVSLGIQSIVDDNIKFLNRHHDKNMVIDCIKLLKEHGFNNINVDLIYGLPNQTIDVLKQDIDFILSLDINHVSTYSLIIEENTKLAINKVKNIDEELDYQMYKYICDRLNNDFIHYEISNFAKTGFESKHNLTYWNNECYYGFGLGASGYINNIRYDNTRSLSSYLKGNHRINIDKLDLNTKIENEFILGLRKIKGINKDIFYQKYNIKLENIEIVKKLLKEKKLIDDKENIFINEKYIYVSNSILIEFIGGSYG